ncbi:MAG: DUF429 domain-containing protein [Candidatus Woesearchaeota archaeon]
MQVHNFYGVDLAWSAKHRSGFCHLVYRNNKLKIQKLCLLQSMQEILQHIQQGWVGVDASLLVNNEHGYRDSEWELSQHFRSYGCPAYPTNKKILEPIGFRGQELSFALQQKGYSVLPTLSAKTVIEVYTHSALVGMFNLASKLSYKYKPKRSRQQRNEAFDILCALLQTYVYHPILSTDFTTLQAKQLKEVEDMLDSIVCALAVYYYYKKPSSCQLFGKKNGIIMSPMPHIS